MADHDRRRQLPSIDYLARAVEARQGMPSMAGTPALEAARRAVNEAREAIEGGSHPPSVEALVDHALLLRGEAERASLRRVINASGVLLHTNLGRAPLSERARLAVEDAARGYTNLEFDLQMGRRSSRHLHARDIITRATGAEDAVVVNNNAAAVLFVLQAFASTRNVIVSRGEAVEIGGGFRIPDIIRQSGAAIVEVGTTNRTYASDYAAAIDESAAAILRVHPSNFRVSGFTARPQLHELVTLARERSLVLIDDLGSGALIPTERCGLAHEPMVQESVRAGADLILFSGDKLVGGPQCGIIAGRSELIEQLRRHPLARALRVDKLTIAALSATLHAYVDGTEQDEIPIWRMLVADFAQLEQRAQRWVESAGRGRILTTTSMVGGGTLPEEGVATPVAAIPVGADADARSEELRRWEPPIITRIADNAILLDPRTVDGGDDDEVARALASVFRSHPDVTS